MSGEVVGEECRGERSRLAESKNAAVCALHVYVRTFGTVFTVHGPGATMIRDQSASEQRAGCGSWQISNVIVKSKASMQDQLGCSPGRESRSRCGTHKTLCMGGTLPPGTA